MMKWKFYKKVSRKEKLVIYKNFIVYIEHDGKVEGEVYVKGPAIFKYYFNKEEATRKAFDSQGYYMMGKYLIFCS